MGARKGREGQSHKEEERRKEWNGAGGGSLAREGELYSDICARGHRE